MTNLVSSVLGLFAIAGLVYLVLFDASYLLMAVIGYRGVTDYVRRRPARDYNVVAESVLSPGITILVPAHNEEATIIASVRALLAVHYHELHVLVIDDGSKDSTLALLTDEFRLVPIDRVANGTIPHKPERALLRSVSQPQLTVLSKEGGGKADALNAGISHVSTPLFCTIDADTLLARDALARMVWEFEARPRTVAAGGIVRVLNGGTVRDGRLVSVGVPGDLLVDIQILEYLRAFLGGRIGWSRLGMLLVISGAFGLFRTGAVVEVGGYDTNTVGEDAELVLRLQRHSLEQRRDWRLVFFPDPICWTEAPESARVLINQRDRWQRGLIEMLAKHRGMLLRPRYRRIGLLALPYFIVFEAFGPLLEVIGGAAVVSGLVLGVVPVSVAALFLALAVAAGFMLSFIALLIEQRAYSRYPSWRDLRRLLIASVAENVGYRQMMAIVRAKAWITVITRRGGWGTMTRTGVGTPPAEAAPQPSLPLPTPRPGPAVPHR